MDLNNNKRLEEAREELKINWEHNRLYKIKLEIIDKEQLLAGENLKLKEKAKDGYLMVIAPEDKDKFDAIKADYEYL